MMKIIRILLLAVMTLVMASVAYAVTPACGTINSTDGAVITFDSDLSCSGGIGTNAIEITGDNIIIDCAGFGIICSSGCGASPAEAGILVNPGADNLTIRNCRNITGFFEAGITNIGGVPSNETVLENSVVCSNPNDDVANTGSMVGSGSTVCDVGVGFTCDFNCSNSPFDVAASVDIPEFSTVTLLLGALVAISGIFIVRRRF